MSQPFSRTPRPKRNTRPPARFCSDTDGNNSEPLRPQKRSTEDADTGNLFRDEDREDALQDNLVHTEDRSEDRDAVESVDNTPYDQGENDGITEGTGNEEDDPDDFEVRGGGSEEENDISGDRYVPPELLYLTRGHTTGCIRKVSDHRSQVSMRYFVDTAITCPCENSSCKELVNVGRWGRMGGGSTVCVHCKLKRKGEWRGAGFGFMGKEDLVRHLNTGPCRTARGLSFKRTNTKRKLGEDLVHAINHPANKKRKEDRTGTEKEYFSCPSCHRECLWRSRFTHCMGCYPLNESGSDSVNTHDGSE